MAFARVLVSAGVVAAAVALTGTAPALAADATNTGFAGLRGPVSIAEPLAIDLSLAANSRDLASSAPLMVARRTPGHGDSVALTLRGLGDVHTLVDGIDVGANNDFGLFDIDFVRIDSGPQGRMGGPNAGGGIVDVELARPADKVGGYLGVGWGSFAHWDLRASFDMPVSDALQVKVSGYKQFDHGYVRNNVTGERLGRDELSGLRFAARLAPSDTVTWNVAVAYMAAEGSNILNETDDPTGLGGGSRYSATGMTRRDRPGGAPQYALVGPSGAALDISGRKAGFPLGSKREGVLFTSDLFLGSDSLNLQLLTGYLDSRHKGALDFGDGRVFPNPTYGFESTAIGAENGGIARLFDNHEKRFSQEVRVAGDLVILRYYAGAYFSNVRLSEDVAGWETVVGAVPGVGGVVPGDPVASGFFDRQPFHKQRTWAGYAGFAFDPLWNLTISGSLRYTSARETLDESCGPLCIDALRGKWAAWTPGAAIEWRPGGKWLLYASATRGLMIPTLDEAATIPEKATGWTYEAGAKRNFGPVAIALSGFATRYKRAFSGSAPPLPPGVSAEGAEWWRNVGDFSNTGAELRVEAAPVPRSRVWVAAGVQDAKWKKVLPAAPGACPDDNAACLAGVIGVGGQAATPAFAPDWTLKAGASVAFPIPYAGIFLEPLVDVDYRSSMALTPAGMIAGSRVLVNAALGVRTDDSNWLLRFECRNCFNRTYVEEEAFGAAYLGAPRSWMLKATRTF